jgi:hypothetical protein
MVNVRFAPNLNVDIELSFTCEGQFKDRLCVVKEPNQNFLFVQSLNFFFRTTRPILSVVTHSFFE